MHPTRQTGDWGERIALDAARSRGYRLIATNVACRFGEVDLVVEDGDVLVFVEVKTRRWSVGRGLQAVCGRKQRRLEMAARRFLAGFPGGGERVCRFDVCVVTPGPQVTWIEDAFQPAG